MCNLTRETILKLDHAIAGIGISSDGMRELSALEIELINGSAIDWGAVYSSATAGMIGGAIGGAITGAIGGAFIGGVGAGPGAMGGFLGGAVGGGVTDAASEIFTQLRLN